MELKETRKRGGAIMLLVLVWFCRWWFGYAVSKLFLYGLEKKAGRPTLLQQLKKRDRADPFKVI